MFQKIKEQFFGWVYLFVFFSVLIYVFFGGGFLGYGHHDSDNIKQFYQNLGGKENLDNYKPNQSSK